MDYSVRIRFGIIAKETKPTALHNLNCSLLNIATLVISRATDSVT